MFWQIKAATRMTNWDAQTIIPFFDFLHCHCYQLDIWMKNQLRNFDPFKNRKTNSVIRKSLEEYGTAASPYAAHLLQLWGAGVCALDQAAQGPAQNSLLPSGPDVPGGKICSSVLLPEHTHSHVLLAILHILTKAQFQADVSQVEMEMVE